MCTLKSWIFFCYTFGDSLRFLIYLRLASDKLQIIWIIFEKMGRIIFIRYGRDLKNYFGKSYVYLKNFSYFSSLYIVMDE
jgi:hypothetical protein